MSINNNDIEKILSKITFKVGKKLGEGMFSTVKLGTHSLTGEQVAIKILEKTKITKIEDKERINKEIEVMKKVNHYNVSKLYTVIDTKLTIYLIQEYVQGKEFLEYLNKKGKLKESDACKFFHQIISGLDYLHQCGIAHRDFKPENILLTKDNQILKIIDFGLSNTYKKGQLLKTGCGSPCYVPPEMIKEENYDGALADIWSAGVILYLMLCGKLPFYDDDNQILYEKILEGKYETPEHLSKDVLDLLSKILEIDPKKRINFEEIKSHPWFSIIDKKYLMHRGINITEDIIPIDEEILQKMEKLGFNNKVDIRYNILKNYHNKITTIYDLLLKQKIENNKKSVADLNSDLYDEYINDKKNKINFYGNIENMLKNRIGEEGKIVNNIPNSPENKYDDNNEKVIVGDTGSVIERLIKAGKFTYDEENMCVNKVVNTRQSNLKDNNDNDGDSKFKTISSMKTDRTEKNKFKKITVTDFDTNPNPKSPEISKKKKKNVHFQESNEENKILYKSPNPKKSKIKRFTESNEDDKNEKKEKNEEDEDWYKEMEELIDLENRRFSERITYKKKKEKILKECKTSNLQKQKKGNSKTIIPEFEIEKEDTEDKHLSVHSSKSKITKATSKKIVSKFANNPNEEKKPINKYKSTRIIKRDTKKLANNPEGSSNSNKTVGNNNKNTKTAKTLKKTIQIVKNAQKITKNRDNSEGKKDQYKKEGKLKKINGDKDETNADEGQRRNQSAQRRKVKNKI